MAEGLRHASPALATQVDALCATDVPEARRLRKAVLSVARYVLRAQHRPTPFGLFAGVTTAMFATRARAEWGGSHVVTARAGAEWLNAVIARLEACSELVERLPVVVNNTVTTRGDRLIVPYAEGRRARAVEVSLKSTAPVRMALAGARRPIPVGALVDMLSAAFPATAPERVQALLGELLKRRVLITNLHAPSTATDALGYLLERLDEVDVTAFASVAETVRELRAVQAGLDQCGRRAGRDHVAARMRALVPGLRHHPLALDVRLGVELDLPVTVAREIERAAWVLTRVCAHPFGTEAWRAYHQRFYERYGIGTMVPLHDVVADSGIGFPDGYPGAPSGAGRVRLSARDDTLLRIAQGAALDGSHEVVLTEEHLAGLDIGPEQPRVPPHLEVGVRVDAASVEDLQRGRFRLEVASVSRGAGVSTGRFLSVLAREDRKALTAELTDLPTADEDSLLAQLSFPPLLPASAHVTRSPRVLPALISVQEHLADDDGDVLTPDDLAVACDGRRMYLAAPGRGQRVEALGLHALNLRTHTPPLVRFLTELSRAQAAQVSVFDWGAASVMPFLPRLRYGRTVLAPARWRLDAAELSGSPWDAALVDWRERRRVPRRVFLVEGDRRLLLDLDEAGHRTLLRAHLDGAGTAHLEEGPEPSAYGWCDGHAHEIVVPLKATRPAGWPALPAPSLARVFSAGQVQTPAAAPVLLAALYGDARRQDELLARHLPELLRRLGTPPWWFIRFRDPDPHLRLRIALSSPDEFGATARTVSAWADDLRAAGLLSDLRYPTSFREMGRWGSGPAWEAAEEAFRADSRAVLAQLRERQRPPPRALVAAHTVAITAGFLGSVEAGVRWLIDHIPAKAPEPVLRRQFVEAVRFADPTDEWAALRHEPGGAGIVTAWADRAAALASYRPHLPGPHTEGMALDDVLTSLIHVHFVRHVAVNFPEESICLYLARAAALAWKARAGKGAGPRP
ncbi:lantibiotic dehydratase [Streptomyces aculeolatus]|uniref:lantibiotic dehydratase n=1 Tax=Streptomyces aculeolatus TaxID=270689 RepID=UPI001CEC4797|nr:lantibiotic dehydratase [Streptomyces aculeolatus]